MCLQNSNITRGARLISLSACLSGGGPRTSISIPPSVSATTRTRTRLSGCPRTLTAAASAAPAPAIGRGGRAQHSAIVGSCFAIGRLTQSHYFASLSSFSTSLRPFFISRHGSRVSSNCSLSLHCATIAAVRKMATLNSGSGIETGNGSDLLPLRNRCEESKSPYVSLGRIRHFHFHFLSHIFPLRHAHRNPW